MQANDKNAYQKYIDAISLSGLTIYDPIDIGDLSLWIPSKILEELLNQKLKGLSLAGLPLRTRSKVLKQSICLAMGYSVPKSFKKTKPRFPGQNFDTYIQKSNNLQIWNEEIDPLRRYVIIKVNNDDIIVRVRVITGQELALLDKTGTLTRKYQAKLIKIGGKKVIQEVDDTENVKQLDIRGNREILVDSNPTDFPDSNSLLPIQQVYTKLSEIIGSSFDDIGSDQERNRGAILHKLVCQSLGYKNFKDNGQFPDILNQLIEIKLQMSQTIDLGLISPDSLTYLDIPKLNDVGFRHCDVRYAVFTASLVQGVIQIDDLYLVTGESFFKFFTKFQGKVVNSKIQIPLPNKFFELESENLPD